MVVYKLVIVQSRSNRQIDQSRSIRQLVIDQSKSNRQRAAGIGCQTELLQDCRKTKTSHLQCELIVIS